MAINEIDENKPAAPVDLTETAESKPAAPTNLTEVAESSPAAPTNLTEVAESSPAAPTNLTETAESKPAAPTNLTEIAESSPAAPIDLTEIALNPLSRALKPLINYDFGSGAYAQLESSASFNDLFTYTRASSATFINRRIGKLGRYEYFLDTDYVGNVENLLTYSEQFDNVDWTKSNVSVNQNTASKGGYSLIENSTAFEHFVSQEIASTSTAVITHSILVKDNGHNRDLRIRCADSGGFIGSAFINPATGLIRDVNSSLEVGVSYEGGGWFKLTAAFTSATNTDIFIGAYLVERGATATSYQGDGVSSVSIDQAQSTESAKPLPYVKTLSAAVTQAFTESIRREYNPVTGEALGALIEGVSTNLQTHSEDFSNVAWTKTSSTVSSNQIAAPDGTRSADKITPSAASNGYIANSVSFTSGTKYTASIFAKAGEFTEIILLAQTAFAGSNMFTTFDLAAGTKTDDATNPPDDSGMEAIGGGWYRCWITITATVTTSSSFQFARVLNGDGSSGLYIWGAQTEALALPTSYSRTEGSTVSRSADNLAAASTALPDIRTGQAMSVYCEASFNEGGDDLDRGLYSENLSDGQFVFSRYYGTSTQNVVAYRSGADNNIAIGKPEGLNKYITTVDNQNIFKTYFNGSNVVSGVERKPSAEGAFDDLIIGRFAASSEYLYGHVKRLAIYDIELTAQEVAQL